MTEHNIVSINYMLLIHYVRIQPKQCPTCLVPPSPPPLPCPLWWSSHPLTTLSCLVSSSLAHPTTTSCCCCGPPIPRRLCSWEPWVPVRSECVSAYISHTVTTPSHYWCTSAHLTCSHVNVYNHHCSCSHTSQQCLQYWYTVYVSPSVPPLLPGRVQGVINQIIQLEGGCVSCTDFRVHFYCPFTSSLILLTGWPSGYSTRLRS